MTKNTFEIKQVATSILIWSVLIYLLDVLGIGLTKLIDEYAYGDNMLDLLVFQREPFLQSLFFSICLLVSYGFTKRKSIILYSFAFSQFFLLNLCFFAYLEKEEEIRFVASYGDLGVDYLHYNLPSLIFLLNYVKPFEGIFSCGIFSPLDTAYFYILWIFLPIVYYFILTYLTDRILQLQLKLNSEGSSEPFTKTLG